MTTSSKDLWSSALNTLTESDRQQLRFHDGQNELSVLADLQELTGRAKDQCVRKRWRFRKPGRNGETLVLRDVFAKMVHWIDAFKQIGDIIVQYDPGHAALPWAGVRFILQIAVGDIVKFGFVVEGAESIARMIGRYAVFEQIYLRSTSKASTELENALVQLYSTILMYQSKAKHFFDENKAKRIIRSAFVTEDEMVRLAKKMDVEESIVDRCAATLNTENQASINDSLEALSIGQDENYAKLKGLLQSIDEPIHRMSSQLNDIEDNLDKSKRQEILRWLSAQPYHEHHEQIWKKALAGTGRWLVEDSTYAEWHKGSTSSLLWLHGKVGAGKSTLVSIVVEDAIRRSEAGRGPPPVYFYCSRDAAEPQRSDAAAIFSSIVRQLSCAEPGLPLLPPVVDMYEEKGQGFNSRGLQIDDSRDIIMKLIEYYPMTTIIIDALDECNAEEREKLLDAVESLLKDSSFGLLKVFLSSRDDQDIACTLRDYPNVDLVASRNSADIEAFVREETNRLVKKQRLLRNSNAKEALVALIIDEISSGADGMFRWASLQLEMLCKMRTDQDVRQRLGRMPPKLEQLYEELYEKALNESQGEVGRSIISNTLKWLLCAQRPMKSSEFCTAVVWKSVPAEELTKEKVLDLCHSFVVFDDSLDVFRFAHLSVREFLEKQAEYMAISCHLFAAETCLLLVIGLSDWLPAKTFLEDHYTLELYAKAASTTGLLVGFHTYATSFWIIHCQLIGEEGRKSNPCFEQIFRFLFSDASDNLSPLYTWSQYEQRHHGYSSLQVAMSVAGPQDRVYLVACAYGFCEIVRVYMCKKLPSDWLRGWRLAVEAGEFEVSRIILSTCNEDDISLSLVCDTMGYMDSDTLDWVLRKTKFEVSEILSFLITQRIAPMTVESLIARYKLAEVSQPLVNYAASNCSASTLEILLRQTNDNEDSWDWDSLMEQANNNENTEVLILLLRKKHFKNTPKLMQMVAKSGKENDMRLLLDQDDAGEITSKVIDASARNLDEKVLGLLIDRAASGRSIISKKAIRRAIENPNEKILSLLLDNGHPISQNIMDQVAAKGYLSSLRLLLNRGGMITSSVLRYAAGNRYDGANVMKLLLAEADHSIVLEEMMEMMKIAVYGDNKSVVRLLLDRAGDIPITEDVLATAALHDFRGEMIKLLSGKDWEMTTELLEAIMRGVAGGEVLQLVLDRPKDFELTEKVLLAAANNNYFGDRLVAQLMDKVIHLESIDPLLVEAAGNKDLGLEILRLIQLQNGHINVSQKALERAAQYGSVRTMAFLLDDTSAPITEAVVVGALMSGELDMVRLVFDRATDLPTTRTMVSASYSNECFSLLWERVCAAEMTEDVTRDLAQAAIEDCHPTKERFKIFLNQVKDLVTTPEAIINIARRSDESVPLLELLIDHGAIVQITLEILQAAATSKQPALITFLLDRSDGIELTDDIFRAAAGMGNEVVLQVLSNYCGLAEVSEKWLDIVRLREAFCVDNLNLKYLYYARNANIHLQLGVIEELIGRGVELDTPDAYGDTPLYFAAYRNSELAVQALLSAGANPNPMNKAGETPLHYAAGGGCFAVVEILLDLGVPTHVEDKRGQTPASIAKDNGHLKIFRLLERRKKP